MPEVAAVNQEKIEIYVELESLVEEGNSILKTKFETRNFVQLVDFGKYKSWHTKVLSYLHIILPKDSPYYKYLRTCNKLSNLCSKLYQLFTSY